MTILGQVASLAANDKIPGEYLESRDETGAGVGTRYLWIEALKASGAGDLTVNTEERDIFNDEDALTAFGASSEGYRMCLRALRYGVPIKASAHAATGSPAAATVGQPGRAEEGGGAEPAVGTPAAEGEDAAAVEVKPGAVRALGGEESVVTDGEIEPAIGEAECDRGEAGAEDDEPEHVGGAMLVDEPAHARQ